MSMVGGGEGTKGVMSMGMFLKCRECWGKIGLNICNMEHIMNIAKAKGVAWGLSVFNTIWGESVAMSVWESLERRDHSMYNFVRSGSTKIVKVLFGT